MNAPARTEDLDTISDRLRAARRHILAAEEMALAHGARELAQRLETQQKAIAALLPAEYVDGYDRGRLARIRNG